MAKHPNLNHDPEHIRAMAAKGAKASVAARKQRKAMAGTLKYFLRLPLKNGEIDESARSLMDLQGMNVTVQDAMTMALIKKALRGDVRAYEIIRDTVGEKPQIEIKSDVSVIPVPLIPMPEILLEAELEVTQIED